MENIKEIIESLKKVSDDFEIGMCGKQFREILASEREESVKQVRYENLGRCPRHDEALRCPDCLQELNDAKDAD